jgi:hypothetical protein
VQQVTPDPMTETSLAATRRSSILALLGLLAGCGGGGAGGGNGTLIAGTLQTESITARGSGARYPLYIYLPPDSDTIRATLPVVYLLDGESRTQTLVDIVRAMQARVIVVGIGNEALRAYDYVPPNLCTPGGGGEARFLDFIRLDLIPFIETNFGGDPRRRILLGHSHGGSFVLYALFAEAAASHHFSAYLASDASIGCMVANVDGWEAAYAAANTALPVRLHVAYAGNEANAGFALKVQRRNYSGLTLAAQLYGGGHIGMIPMAFTDALAFALA